MERSGERNEGWKKAWGLGGTMTVWGRVVVQGKALSRGHVTWEGRVRDLSLYGKVGFPYVGCRCELGNRQIVPAHDVAASYHISLIWMYLDVKRG